MPLALEFAEITKEYRTWPGRKTVRALQKFSLSVHSGEIFGFLGPNAAGKSTAIHLAMGFMRPSSGRGRHSLLRWFEWTTRSRPRTSDSYRARSRRSSVRVPTQPRSVLARH